MAVIFVQRDIAIIFYEIVIQVLIYVGFILMKYKIIYKILMPQKVKLRQKRAQNGTQELLFT